MVTIALDVHTKKTQLCVSNQQGVILLEKVVQTDPAVLRREVAAIGGPKRVVFEHGPLAGLITDALEGLVEELVACDPTRNALIAKAEDSNDERDARRLGLLARTGSLQHVYVPAEPFRTIRSLSCYESQLTRQLIQGMQRIKALYRRYGVQYAGRALYSKDSRGIYVDRLPTAATKFQVESHYRLYDTIRQERVALRRELRRILKPMPVFARLQSVPGVGAVVASTLIAWIVDPGRFRSRSALCAYAGLGLRQNVTSWAPTMRARASLRGQREVKRCLFLAARAAVMRTQSAFASRYQARRSNGWEDRKAIRDVARCLLFSIAHIWRTGEAYTDGRIGVPGTLRMQEPRVP